MLMILLFTKNYTIGYINSVPYTFSNGLNYADVKGKPGNIFYQL